jgi:predicted HTH domain antitoxin
MVQMTIEMPESALAALRKDPDAFAKEFRLVAAVKWYEMRQISQERAAEIAALSRAEFVVALARFGVSPFQYDADEVIAEAEDG